MKGEDKDAIEAKTQALTEASAKMAERVYAQAQESAGAASRAGTSRQPGGKADDVVDAEFEEVKTKTRSKASRGQRSSRQPVRRNVQALRRACAFRRVKAIVAGGGPLTAG